MEMKDLLFSFQGRVCRKTYWLFLLALAVLGFIAGVLAGLAGYEDSGVAVLILTVLIVWPWLAIQVKRWHDTNRSGWWLLITFVPIIGPIWALVVNGFFRGDQGENQYGDDPLEEETVPDELENQM